MAKKSKLLAALDAHKGRDYELKKQKKLQKQAAKKKSSPQLQSSDVDGGPPGAALVNGTGSEPEVESEGWESKEDENAVAGAVCWYFGSSIPTLLC